MTKEKKMNCVFVFATDKKNILNRQQKRCEGRLHANLRVFFDQNQKMSTERMFVSSTSFVPFQKRIL